MKVIQALPELNTGGVERGTLELSRYLCQQGDQSIVMSAGGTQLDRLEQEGGRHIQIPVHRKHPVSLWYVRAVRRVLLQEKPDIVHVRSRVPAWLVWLAWRQMPPQTRPKLVTTVHGFYSVNRYSRIMTRGQSVICVSQSVKDYVLKNYPDVPEDRLAVIHRGVDPIELPWGYTPSPHWLEAWRTQHPRLTGRFVVTLPGRLTRWKGQLDFLKVIAKLRQRGLPVHGLIAGGAHPRKQAFLQELRETIEQRGLADDISLIGPRSDLRDVMAVSDVVVSCSTDPEAFGRVTLEAISLGRMVAGYDHGGVREQLIELMPQGRVPVGSPEAMADLLARWYEVPQKPKPNNPFTLDRMCASIRERYLAMLRVSRQ